MNNFSFWQKWLFAAGLLIAAFGILMAFFNGTFLFQIMNSQINPVFWGAVNISESDADFQKFIYGVLGATMAGWGIFIAFLARYPFRNRERWAWNCITAGMLIWYSIDTSISLYFNVYFNAALNTLILIVFALPLLFTRKHFNRK